jgi:transcriptional regulator with XRE-family HTH domain
MEQPGAGFYGYKQRIVFSLLRAAVRVAQRLDVPLDQLVGLLEMAAFREAREQQGLELAEIAGRFGKSLRTVSSLNRRFRGDFFSAEDEVALRREVAMSLDRAPAARDVLATRFPAISAEALRGAVHDLLREGRVLETEGVLRRDPEMHDFFDATDIAARVDGLNRQMDIVADTVWNRWIEPGKQATARTYVFTSSDADFDALVADVLARVRERAIAADAAGDPDARRRGLTLAATTLEDAP